MPRVRVGYWGRRAIKRRLFNVAALVSLILWGGFVSAWLLSHARWDSFVVWRGRPAFTIESDEGQLLFVRRPEGFESHPFHLTNEPGYWRYQGYEASTVRWVPYDPSSFAFFKPQGVLVTRYYLLVIISAVLPVLWMVDSRRSRKSALSTCPACSYDLRGSPGTKCPECGASSPSPSRKP